jgi:hypothetical protein
MDLAKDWRDMTLADRFVLVCEHIAVTAQTQHAYADWRRSVCEPWLRQHGFSPDGSRTLLDTPEGGPTCGSITARRL